MYLLRLRITKMISTLHNITKKKNLFKTVSFLKCWKHLIQPLLCLFVNELVDTIFADFAGDSAVCALFNSSSRTT